MELNINTTDVELNDYQPIPNGWYNAQIIEESERDTKNGGKQLVYKFRIYGEKANGRTLFENFNVQCGSEKAEAIARTQIGKLGKACKVENVVYSSDLINGCCQIKVDSEEYEGKTRNKIVAYDYASAENKEPSTSSSGKKQWWEK